MPWTLWRLRCPLILKFLLVIKPFLLHVRMIFLVERMRTCWTCNETASWPWQKYQRVRNIVVCKKETQLEQRNHCKGEAFCSLVKFLKLIAGYLPLKLIWGLFWHESHLFSTCSRAFIELCGLNVLNLSVSSGKIILSTFHLRNLGKNFFPSCALGGVQRDTKRAQGDDESGGWVRFYFKR